MSSNKREILTVDQMKDLVFKLEEAKKQVETIEKSLGIEKFGQADVQSFIKLSLGELHEGIQIIDNNWKYIYLNDAVVSHSKNSRENLIGKTMMDCFPGIEDTEMFKVLTATKMDGKIRRLEHLFEYPNGEKLWFELYVSLHSLGLLIRSFDITEKKELEMQHSQLQRMESLGKLAAGVAHDFNNKLSIMLLCNEQILKKKGISGSVEALTRSCLKAVKQSGEITRQLLAFSRKQVLSYRVANINEIISQNRSNLERLIGEDIQVIYSLSDNLCNTYLDPTQMDQILLNLFINARDAMKDGGKLVIKTENAYLDEIYTNKKTGVFPGKYVVLSITDNGVGMDEITKKKIFEPFYTTKNLGEGTGLGLSTVHGIVKQLSGHIWTYSEVGLGTTFKIYFPITDEVSEIEIDEEAEKIIDFHGTESILLTEDEPELRKSIEYALQSYGYNVTSVADGESALKAFSKSKFDILLTDLILGDFRGDRLAATILLDNPETKIIIMTGYDKELSFDQNIEHKSSLLQKPISTESLLTTIRRILNFDA